MAKHSLKRNPGIPSVTVAGDRIILRNDYWEVIHDKAAGGAIASLRFFNGTALNILKKPVYAHVAVGEDRKVVFYRQSCSVDAVVRIDKRQKYMQINATGHFYSEQGARLPVRFKQSYEYRDWGLVKVGMEFIIEKQLDRVYEFSPCNFYLTPEIDTLGLRPSTPSGLRQVMVFCRWQEVGFSRSYKDSRDPVPETMIPIYFCAFKKGVEGLEFYRGSDSEAWNRPFDVEEEGQSIFTHERDLRNEHFYVRCESYCDWGTPRKFKSGRQGWEYYLGLPFIKKPENVGNKLFHAGVDSNWPDDATLKSISESGITLLRHHDDDTFKPKGWPDGKYPPYAPEDMLEMDRIITTAHRCGMKITPYFSLKEFHPKCPVYAKKAHEWKRQIDRIGTILFEDGPFGGYMCMKSGWLEYRKKTIDKVLKKHEFDGVYYDHMWFHTCRHPEHCGGLAHTDVDEVLDFYAWTRKRIGPNGVMFIHCSGTPSMVAENMSDLVFVSEDFFKHRALPGNFDPLCEFVPITPRHTVSSYANLSPEPDIYRPQHLSCFLEGWPPYAVVMDPTDNGRFLMGEIAKFRKYDLSRFKFIPARKQPVVTGDHEVYASLYYNSRQILIYCANLSAEVKTVHLHLSGPLKSKFGKFNAKIRLTLKPFLSAIADIKQEGKFIHENH